MKSYLFTLSWGVVVWLCAILFFRFFGEYILHQPGSTTFIISITLLITVTGCLLYIITLIYMRFDPSNFAPLKLGVVGTCIGLFLDAFSLSLYPIVFPQLNESQIIAFTVWMSAAYALYLMIPALMNIRKLDVR